MVVVLELRRCSTSKTAKRSKMLHTQLRITRKRGSTGPCKEALVTKVAVSISEPSVKRFGQLLGTIHIVVAEAAD